MFGRILAKPHNIADHIRRFSSYPKFEGGVNCERFFKNIVFVAGYMHIEWLWAQNEGSLEGGHGS